ncbi:MAG: restriction endonuclease subunit S [Candidatus Limivicinus sp.]|nr:restriction endonuclease subunit S [Clostridiales bacterium]MDY6132229.1 restriction endonuclease subunit S [Candidatus Limivicinus sp.]
MTPQELKASILQLAIQGKLVEQRPEEGTGEELYRQIQAEKQKLIEEGKIKKEKPLPEISEDEIPFDIPENWKWIRLRTAVYNRGQITPNTTFSYIDIGSIDNKRQSLNSEENIIEPGKAPSRARKIVEYGDILYSTVRPYLHNMCIIDRNFSFMPIASTGFATMTCYTEIYNKYLFYYLMSPAFDMYANNTENAKGVAYPAINDSCLYRAVIAIPPFAEQKRIVAKIEELLPYIDRYEKAWSRLEDFNKRFPVDMQKSILQMAIQGKLVEQRPEEGTGEELYRQIQAEKQKLIEEEKIKKEKPLPEITEDEIPFDIPESWKWCRLNDVSLMIGDIDHKMPPTVEAGGIPYISPLNFTKEGGIDYSGAKHISFNDFVQLGKKCTPSKNDIIFPRYGTIGVIRIVETDQPFLASYSCCTIKSLGNDSMLYKYVFYVMKSHLVQNEINRYINKTTQPNVGLQSIKQFLFPLPPLAEQKRIVAKLEEILPLCEKLK